ncbi:cytochrome C biogenesis protein [Allorhizobium sp. BGMRC 0089]|uniref:protein-disulfide reductase DsbD domain-containing protein n=1 Tax=Allorhizobium sonneratiae TaxID=2934936 RepID=UPI0020332A7C|nr:protein-disulfide reductase DsbD domain-containing protein [Allorhizobium sonneratiae]MCM2294477.1 cytochrome C biogenesis protein [Allorhizobium sonneratiae]
MIVSLFLFCLRCVVLAGLMIAASLASAFAASSDWVVSEGGRMRLILLAPAADGSREAGLQIVPNPGWFTYWREPGDAGIPPQISPQPGSAIKLSQLAFPVPEQKQIGTVRDIGYAHPVTFLFTITPDGRQQAKAFAVNAFIGLCHNICIPFQASLSIDALAATSATSEEAMLIAAAKAREPEQPTADFHVADFHLAKDQSRLDLDLVLPNGSATAPNLFLTGPEGVLFTDYRVVKRDGNHMSVNIVLTRLSPGEKLSGQVWRLLVDAANGRAMEAPLAFANTGSIVP